MIAADVRTLHAAKPGNAPEEYEDAAAFAFPEGDGRPLLRVAVADGATGATFSGLWARLLCEGFASGALGAAELPAALPELGKRWREEVGRRPLPWHAIEKVKAGAFATLCGLALQADGAWDALAVGDCCLFQVRDDERLVAAFPLSRADDFNSSPALIGAYPASNAELPRHVRSAAGTAEPGDALYLMSDALARWFVASAAEGRRPWRWLPYRDRPDGPLPFEEFTRQMWAEQGLAEDDVTVAAVVIRAGGGE